MDALLEKKIMSLLSDDPSSILLIKDSLATENMWTMCIQEEPSLFQYVKHPSPELCKMAVSEDGANLKYCVSNPNVTVTSEMCYAAVESYPPAIFDVPMELQDHRIREYAFDLDPTLMHAFSDIRQSYIDAKLKEDPTFCRYLPCPTEDMEYRAIEADPNYCVHVRKFTPRIRGLIKTLYPEIIPLLTAFNNHDDVDN